jgi:hypothetical protein
MLCPLKGSAKLRMLPVFEKINRTRIHTDWRLPSGRKSFCHHRRDAEQ